MGDQALRIAKIVRDAHELECVLEAEGATLAAGDLEGDPRRASARLCLLDGGLRGMAAPRPPRRAPAPTRRPRARLAPTLDAHAQRLEPLQQHPGIKRRD